MLASMFPPKKMSVPTAHARKDKGLETIATGRVRLTEKSFSWSTSTISFLPSITLKHFMSARHTPCRSQPASDYRDLNYGCSSFIVCTDVPLCYFIRQRLLWSSLFTLLQPITFDISRLNDKVSKSNTMNLLIESCPAEHMYGY